MVEYIRKCLLQELFLMITNKEFENLKFSDVDIEKGPLFQISLLILTIILQSYMYLSFLYVFEVEGVHK